MLADDSRRQRFLSVTGLTPDGLRAGLGDAAVQGAVLDFLAAHEPDLIAAADALAVPPDSLIAARMQLAGGATRAAGQPW